MPPRTQHPRQRRANEAASSRHQHAQRGGGWRDVVRSGSIASLASTCVVSVFSRLRVGHAAAGTNAASQWFWYPAARFARTPSWRHTVIGYLIHHASSLLWAAGYEATNPARASPSGRAARAAMIASLAYVVDYHVVPRRLSPGFEHKVGRIGMVAVYAAFAAGLWASTRPHRLPGRPQLPRQRKDAQRKGGQQNRRPHGEGVGGRAP